MENIENIESKVTELVKAVSSYVVKRFESDSPPDDFDDEMKQVAKFLHTAASSLETLKSDVESLANYRNSIDKTMQRLRNVQQRNPAKTDDSTVEIGDLCFREGRYDKNQTTKLLYPLFKSGALSRLSQADAYTVRVCNGSTIIYALQRNVEIAMWSVTPRSQYRQPDAERFDSYVRKFQAKIYENSAGTWVSLDR